MRCLQHWLPIRSLDLATVAAEDRRDRRQDHAVRALYILLLEMPALAASCEEAAIIDKARRGSYLTWNSV